MPAGPRRPPVRCAPSAVMRSLRCPMPVRSTCWPAGRPRTAPAPVARPAHRRRSPVPCTGRARWSASVLPCGRPWCASCRATRSTRTMPPPRTAPPRWTRASSSVRTGWRSTSTATAGCHRVSRSSPGATSSVTRRRTHRRSSTCHRPTWVPAMAHMSHDSDGNDDADGQAALDAFAEAGVEVTWCQVYRDNAYSPGIYDKITAAGHEHALHYNAMEDADIAQWGWEQIQGQYAWAQDIIRTDTKITSNRIHFTRWEGWTEFYGWCEKLGITIDESRGPSKLGTVGFPFGTAHVDFPMGDVSVGNRPMDVLNLPLHTQDLAWAGHISCRDVILDQTMTVHGVAHFLYHGPHLRGKPATRASCAELAELARRRGD